MGFNPEIENNELLKSRCPLGTVKYKVILFSYYTPFPPTNIKEYPTVTSTVITFRWSILYFLCFVFCIRHHLCRVVYAATLCIVTPLYAILHHSSRFVY